MFRKLGLAALVAGLCISATPSLAQNAALVQPRSYRVVFENNRVRVLEFISRPGMGVCGSGRHSHPAHLTVLLTPARVRIRENGKMMVVTNKPGDVFWSPPVTHETENVGGGEVRALIIELKSTGPHL
jgi:hypothetical protein